MVATLEREMRKPMELFQGQARESILKQSRKFERIDAPRHKSSSPKLLSYIELASFP